MCSVRCKLSFHKWNKFGKVVNAYGGLTQFRDCKRCGRISYAGCYGNQAKAEEVNRVLVDAETMPVIRRDSDV